MPIRTFIATVLVCVAAMQAVAAQDWDQDRRWRRRDGLQVRVGRDYHLPADQIVSWPVVIVGGSATIDGRVEDDLVVIGGTVRIGPAAQVRANVVSVGGEVQVADGAEVTGEVHDISVLWPELRFALRDWMWGLDRGWWAAFMLAGTVARFALIMVAACLLALIAPGWIRRIEGRVADAPLASGFVGLATEMLAAPLFAIVAVGLVLTIVGIPLLILVPFAVLAFLLIWLAGFASVAARLGGWLRARTRLLTDSPAIDVAWGVMLLFLLTFVGNLLAFGPWFFSPLSTAFGVTGFVIEYLAWTVGLGAALLAPLQRRWQIGPPPVPFAAPAHPPAQDFGTTNA
jgi:hypothetical protein